MNAESVNDEVIRGNGVGKRSGPVRALENINLSVRRGEILACSATTAPESPP